MTLLLESTRDSLWRMAAWSAGECATSSVESSSCRRVISSSLGRWRAPMTLDILCRMTEIEWSAITVTIPFVPVRGEKEKSKSPADVNASSGRCEGNRVVIVDGSRGA